MDCFSDTFCKIIPQLVVPLGLLDYSLFKTGSLIKSASLSPATVLGGGFTWVIPALVRFIQRN